MDILRPKDWLYPKDTTQIRTDPEAYIRRVFKSILELYLNVWKAFKRTQSAIEVVVDIENARFVPPRVAQSAEPTLVAGQATIWRDTDDGKVYLVYNDTDSGQKKVELV